MCMPALVVRSVPWEEIRPDSTLLIGRELIAFSQMQHSAGIQPCDCVALLCECSAAHINELSGHTMHPSHVTRHAHPLCYVPHRAVFASFTLRFLLAAAKCPDPQKVTHICSRSPRNASPSLQISSGMAEPSEHCVGGATQRPRHPVLILVCDLQRHPAGPGSSRSSGRRLLAVTALAGWSE